MRALLIILILALVLTSGIALAADTADLARPQVKRLVAGVENLTGWDCQYRIQDTPERFAVVVWCEK